jgi:hypothetical protein
MKVRYQPLHGAQDIEIRDILGGNALAVWHAGDARDVPDDLKVLFRQAGGAQAPVRAIDALLSVGPDFIDDATGVNPLFVCSVCGDLSLDELYVDRRTLESVHYRADRNDASSPRLCVPCFIAANADTEAAHAKNNIDPAIIAKAHERRAQLGTTPAPAKAAYVPEPLHPAAQAEDKA